MKTKKLIASLVISISMAGSAVAENLSTVHGIPAEAMSHEDMVQIEGKYTNGQIIGAYLLLQLFNHPSTQARQTYTTNTTKLLNNIAPAIQQRPTSNSGLLSIPGFTQTIEKYQQGYTQFLKQVGPTQLCSYANSCGS